MKDSFNLKGLSQSVKVKLLKAFIEGKLTKSDLIGTNPDEIELLISNSWNLMHVAMGEIHTYTFGGRQIDRNEFERLDCLSSALGIERINIKVKEPQE